MRAARFFIILDCSRKAIPESLGLFPKVGIFMLLPAKPVMRRI